MSIEHHHEALFADLIPTSQQILRCPECGGEHCRRGRRRGLLEKSLLSWLQFLPIRCKDCGIRFYSRNRQFEGSEERQPRQHRSATRIHEEFRAIIKQMKEAEAALERASQ